MREDQSCHPEVTVHPDRQLYSYFRSSASFRVRIALNLKGLKYDYKAIHLLKNGGEQRTPEYKALNPFGQVPCFVEQGRALGQSVAIIEYLDECYPMPRLFPLDPWERAKVREIVEAINSGIQPLHNVGINRRLARLGLAPEAIAEWNMQVIEEGLAAVEKLLESSAGTYSLGGEITAADIFVAPQYVSARRFGARVESFPIFSRVAQSCLASPAFWTAAPESQPDFPEIEKALP